MALLVKNWRISLEQIYYLHALGGTITALKHALNHLNGDTIPTPSPHRWLVLKIILNSDAFYQHERSQKMQKYRTNVMLPDTYRLLPGIDATMGTCLDAELGIG